MALLLGGAVLGIVASIPITYELSLRAGRADLLLYSHRILRVLEKGANETRNAELALYNDHLPLCSESEIAMMRTLVYNSIYVRDLGRSRDGKLYCTAARGELRPAMPLAPPSMSFRSGELGLQINIAVDHGLLIAPGIRGIIIDIPGVSAVVNQSLFDGLDEPPFHATGLVRDPEHGSTIYIFGDTRTLSNSEILARRLVDRGRMLYEPLCSARYSVCVIGSARIHDLIAGRKGLFGGSAAVGSVLGVLVTSIIVLLLRHERSFPRRVQRAVRNGELACVYQQVVDIDTGEIVGAEALARWTTADGDSVPPEVFIRVAEERKFVGEITRLMIDRVIDELGPLLYRPDFRVTINISSQDLLNPTFFSHLEQSTAWTGIPASSLAFELTEHSTADHSSAATAIARLRDTGHAIYIDDFGTGYSSLSYLHDLHVDAIKVDRVFTNTVGTDAVTASVMPQILAMADRLGLTVIVEGIETREQAEYFRHARPHTLGQGWYFGKPVPAAEFIAMLQAHRSKVSA